MISNISGSTAGTAFMGSLNENKDIKANAKLVTSQDGSKNKIEKLKEVVDAGEYKLDLSALASKMADELL